MAELQTATAEMPARVPKAARYKIPAALAAIASLRLTVVLFILSLILVFTGTLAQMDAGIWTVVKSYFRSFGVWIPLQLFVRLGQVFLGVPTDFNIPNSVGFPFPGGWTLGALLLINLLAAHAIRFKFTWKRSGILLTHAGIVMLLVGELITGLFQVEATMSIATNEKVNFTDVSHRVELAFVLPGNGTTNDEVTIPEHRLRAGGVITDAALPVDVEVLEYAKNSAIAGARAGDREKLTGADGRSYRIKLDLKESAGVDAGEDIPSVRIRFRKKNSDQEIATGVFSLWYYRNLARLTTEIPEFPPQSLNVDGKTWLVSLRPKREYKPYSLQLLEFKHDVYIGTNTPKNFSSLVRLTNPDEGENRTVLIYMNSPLRYNGETFFQSNFFPGDQGTVLQVVRNPGWLLPYIACSTVTLGMAIHFGLHLAAFLRRRALA